MNTAWEEAIKEAFALAPADQFIYDTLELRQDGVQDSVYMVKHRVGISAYDENGVLRYFRPVNFDFALPASNEEGFTSLNIAVSNIGREASDFVNAAKAEEVPVKVIYRPYLSDDLTAPQMRAPLVMFLKDVEMDSFQADGKATFMDIVNKKFPSELYTHERFPNLQ